MTAQTKLEQALVYIQMGAPANQRAFFAGAAYAAQTQLADPEKLVHNAPTTAWCDTLKGRIFIHPEFAADPALTKEGLAAVIAHEVLHLLRLEHERCGSRDARLWNIAADLIINEDLGDSGWHLPPEVVTLRTIRDFVPDLPEETVQAWTASWRIDLPTTGEVYAAIEQHAQARPAPDHFGKDETGAPQTANTSTDRQDLEEQARRMAEKVASAGEQAQAADPHAGDDLGFLADLLASLRKPAVNWQEALQAFMTARLRQDFSWSRPYTPVWASAGLVIPSVTGQPSIGKVVVLMDTSGSVSDEHLSQFYAELSAVHPLTDGVTLIHFTTEIDAVEEFEPDTAPTKRYHGGTDIPAAMRHMEVHPDLNDFDMSEVSCMLVLSDFYSPLPEQGEFAQWADKVLWVATPDHGTLPDWGQAVHINK